VSCGQTYLNRKARPEKLFFGFLERRRNVGLLNFSAAAYSSRPAIVNSEFEALAKPAGAGAIATLISR
jgi:hypothetical protein